MSGRSLSVLAAKEVRALLPATAACIATMMLSAAVQVWPLSELGFVAYLLGIAALGGLSMGHEYGHRTLGMLLSQPVRRERLLLVKLSVLSVTLLIVSVLGAIVTLPRLRAPETIRMAFVLAPMIGVCVAPWLTMACRSAIAGAAFTLALPGTLITLIQLAYLMAFRHIAPIEIETPALWAGCAGLCAIGAISGWRTFMQLEAIEGTGPRLGVPEWFRRGETAGASAHATSHPIWLLVKKELHLQPIALLVAGLYVLGWIAARSLKPAFPESNDVFDLLTAFYTLMVTLLIGAVAGAEERQLGTLEWQVLLPVSSSRQWAVKVVTVLTVTLVLALGLPALLTSAHIFSGRGCGLGFTVVALAVTALYVSSACNNALSGMLMSLTTVCAGIWAITMLRVELTARLGRTPGVSLIRFDTVHEPLMASVFLVALLWLARDNHRSADRDRRRLWRQGAWLASSLAVGMIIAVLAAR
jgi:hypothetical protein